MRWHTWIGRRSGKFLASVREETATKGLIRAEPYRILGIFPAHRVTVREGRIVAELRDLVAGTLRDGVPANRVKPFDAATTALAATGKMRHVISRAQVRERRQRIKQLSEVAGPVIPALRRAISEHEAATQGG